MNKERAPKGARTDPTKDHRERTPVMVCRFTTGSLWCVNDPCRNPNHTTAARVAEIVARQWRETPHCTDCGVLTRMLVEGDYGWLMPLCGACDVAARRRAGAL